MPLLVDDKNHDASARFYAAVDQAVANSIFGCNVRVAFDCEGVNLCRVGTIELVAICFEQLFGSKTKGENFLVDLNAKAVVALRLKRVQALKKLFECRDVQKSFMIPAWTVMLFTISMVSGW